MSSVIESARPPGPAGEELPYEYGWRDVFRQLPDGSHVVDRIPLTKDEVLHPQDGDVILQANVHDVDRAYLTNVWRPSANERSARKPGRMPRKHLSRRKSRPGLRWKHDCGNWKPG